MNTQTLLSTVARLVVAAVCAIATASCGGEMLRTGRSPVYMVVTNLQGNAGGDAGTPSAFLLSDVQVIVEETVGGVTVRVPTFFNDTASATITIEAKNPTAPTTAMNAVTITRYRVVFRRADGRNTPGVDVPYGFDGAASVTIPAGGSGIVSIDLIRHQAKLEPPLRNLVGFGGLGFISTIAEITFYGHDQNGNELTTTASMDVQFGDFADE
jgi:hypothetical protein